MRILKKINEKKEEAVTLWLSRGTCSYVCMYINAVPGSVILYLQHDFYDIVLKIKHKLYIASGSAPPPLPRKNSGCTPDSQKSISQSAVIET
jgi:hypothetical protein